MDKKEIVVTQEQLKEIENLLIDQYGIEFDEIRQEIVDHIACEIEDQLKQGKNYNHARKYVLGKWHFELKPVVGEKGIPTCIVKELYRKDGLIYVVFALLFLVSWLGGNYGLIEKVLNPWMSFGCVLLGFLISVVVQKRFYQQSSYEMRFYIHALGNIMIVNIVALTVAMLYTRQDFALSFFLSSYHFFVLALHILILNVFFASKVWQYHNNYKAQSI